MDPGEQVDQLANFIMREVEGEPSESQGAVDTAIRLLSNALTNVKRLEQERDELIALLYKWAHGNPLRHETNLLFAKIKQERAK